MQFEWKLVVIINGRQTHILLDYFIRFVTSFLFFCFHSALTNCCNFLNSFGFVPAGTNCNGFSMRTAFECVGEPSATHCARNWANFVLFVLLLLPSVDVVERRLQTDEITIKMYVFESICMCISIHVERGFAICLFRVFQVKGIEVKWRHAVSKITRELKPIDTQRHRETKQI